jgi:hypothetical protein
VPGANRFSTWFAGRLLPWDLTPGAPVVFPDLRYFGEVMTVLDVLMPDAGLHVVITTDLVGPLPVTGCDVVVVCLEDEFGVPPRYAHDVRLVAKTMGGRRRRPFIALWPPRRWLSLPIVVGQEVVVQARRSPWVARDVVLTASRTARADVLDVPLGVRAYEEAAAVPFGERRYDIAFAGSLVNEAHERGRRWASQKLRARRAFLAEVERLQREEPELSVWLRLLPTYWDGAAAMSSYTEALADTRIVLCPRGSWLETYRYFEALRLGCIPVHEALPRRDYYDGAPGIRIRDWSRLRGVVNALLADPDRMREQHEAALQWYETWVSPPAVAARIARHLGGAAVTTRSGLPRP